MLLFLFLALLLLLLLRLLALLRLPLLWLYLWLWLPLLLRLDLALLLLLLLDLFLWLALLLLLQLLLAPAFLLLSLLLLLAHLLLALPLLLLLLDLLLAPAVLLLAQLLIALALLLLLLEALLLQLALLLLLWLGLAGGAAALQPLVFNFLLPPLLRCQALVARRQGRRPGLHGPRGGRAAGRGGAGAGSSRVEFSRFGRTGRRTTRSGRGAALDLPRLRRTAGLDLARFGLAARRRRSRLGCRCRFEGQGFARLNPLLRGQLLNLLLHLGGQLHGGPGGQGRTWNSLARPHRRGLDPGNLGGDPGHIPGRPQQIGSIQVDPGLPDILDLSGRRQPPPLSQGRRHNLVEVAMPVHHRAGGDHIADIGDVHGVVDGGLVNDGLVDAGDPGDISHGRPPAIGPEPPAAAIKGRGIIRGGKVALDDHGLGIEHRHIGRGHQIPGVHIRISRGVGLPET